MLPVSSRTLWKMSIFLPSSLMTTIIYTQSISMLVKVFPNVKAISKESLCTLLLPPIPVQCEDLFKLIVNMAGLSQSYGINMPDWVLAKYFDPEAGCHRLLLYDYQQTEIQERRTMKTTKLIDSLHMPLKSYEDILSLPLITCKSQTVWKSTFKNFWLHSWETGQHSFFMRQLVYN